MNTQATNKWPKATWIPAGQPGLVVDYVLLASALAAVISPHAVSAQPIRTPAPQKTEVVVIGTIHDFHQTNQNFSKEILRNIIIRCQPAAILVELPPTMDGELTVTNGRLAGGFSKADEGWAEQAAANQLSVPIHPFDMDRREEARQEQGYYRRRDAAKTEGVGCGPSE